jgi:hypothetical protein
LVAGSIVKGGVQAAGARGGAARGGKFMGALAPFMVGPFAPPAAGSDSTGKDGGSPARLSMLLALLPGALQGEERSLAWSRGMAEGKLVSGPGLADRDDGPPAVIARPTPMSSVTIAPVPATTDGRQR